jgi:ElaB/YqjD/DUF883 family membrane-anchored ribosome-binding protein
MSSMEDGTMTNKTRAEANPTGEDVDTVVENLTNRARNAAASMTDAAGDAVAVLDERRSTAADGLDTAASALQDRADELPGGDTVRHFARATANRLSTSADYVRSHDAKRMMADVETFVKGNPGPALVAAAAFGFLCARALSRD